MPRANTSAQILKNKRIRQRARSQASASTLTPDLSVSDRYAFSALAGNLTINAPIGNPQDFDVLIFRFTDNGVGRTLTWNAAFHGALPGITTPGKTTTVYIIYNAAAQYWQMFVTQTA